MKILILTKDNKLLYDETLLDQLIVVDNSIDVRFAKGVLLIKLKKDYKTEGNVGIVVKNGCISYNTN